MNGTVQSDPVAWPFYPLVRSGELFTEHGDDFRTRYFDGVASAPAGFVAPEHVFGTNGWRRKLEETGADPVAAFEAFSQEWDALPYQARRDLVVGNAVARFYAPGVAKSVADAGLRASRDDGAAISTDPDLGFLALGDPVKSSEEFQKKLLGASAEPAPDPLADLMADAQGEEAQA